MKRKLGRIVDRLPGLLNLVKPAISAGQAISSLQGGGRRKRGRGVRKRRRR